MEQREDALADQLKGMTVAERVVRAFTVMRFTETESKVVQVLLDRPGGTLTELSRHLSWGGQIWHEKFGTMCKKREVDLWAAKYAVVRDGKFYTGILADLDPNGNRITMSLDVATAFAHLGLKAQL